MGGRRLHHRARAAPSREFHVSILSRGDDLAFAERARMPLPKKADFLTPVDIDGDGDRDFIANGLMWEFLQIYENLGDGTFSLLREVQLGFWTGAPAVGDLDADGDLDLALADHGCPTGPHESLGILVNAGDATFADPSLLAIGPMPFPVIARDLDGDSLLDLAVGITGARGEPAAGGEIAVLLNRSARPFLRGDANADLDVNVADGIACALFASGVSDPVCADAADADDDGIITVADAIHVLTYLFRRGAPPPAPFGESGDSCGIDGTADDLGCEFYPICE